MTYFIRILKSGTQLVEFFYKLTMGVMMELLDYFLGKEGIKGVVSILIGSVDWVKAFGSCR